MLLNDATTICKKAQTLTYLHTFRLVQFSAQNPKPGRNTKFFKLYISYISYRGFPGDFPRSSKKNHHFFPLFTLCHGHIPSGSPVLRPAPRVGRTGWAPGPGRPRRPAPPGAGGARRSGAPTGPRPSTKAPILGSCAS